MGLITDRLLGDSRSDSLKTENFAKNGVFDFYNFSYGGGNLYEAIDSFWFATKYTKLKRVIIGAPFNIFNESNSMNLTIEANTLINNPIKYYLNLFIFQVSILNIYDKYGSKLNLEEPGVSKEEFWKSQLGDVTKGFYRKYKYPDKLLKRLKEITDYCKQNDIQLQFYIPPTHTDLQHKVDAYQLRKEYIQYKKDLAGLGEVIDFDYPNEVTSNRDNYNDPYHFNQNIAEKIVDEILQNTQNFSKRY